MKNNLDTRLYNEFGFNFTEKPFIKNLKHINKRAKLADKCFNICIKKCLSVKKNGFYYITQAKRFNDFEYYYSPFNQISKKAL
mgnify:FL=1|jgi:hypothetical protein|tara:strand:- start:260 stop:508 length:249 start_codon:yes stop_codon:yes gene_type:complete